MTLRLFAVVLALVLLAWVVPLRRWRDLRWFDRWINQCGQLHGPLRVLATLAPWVVVVAVLGILLGLSEWTGVLWLAFSVLVLIYTLGPRYLDTDIDAVIHAEDRAEREQAAQALRVHADDDAALPLAAPALVEATVLSALKRRFGVVFWFLVLGPAGALLYRLAQVLGDDADTDADSRHSARRLAQFLDWPASHLMVFAMALVSDFDAVIDAWRAWHKAPTRSAWAFESGFLGAVARAGVRADVAEGDEEGLDADDPLTELIDTRRLLQRMMVVWLALAAVLVLVGWIR